MRNETTGWEEGITSSRCFDEFVVGWSVVPLWRVIVSVPLRDAVESTFEIREDVVDFLNDAVGRQIDDSELDSNSGHGEFS